MEDPLTPQEKGTKTSLGFYVHVPFCSSTCDFCAFYQEKPKPGDFEGYLDGIALELELVSPARQVDTVFIGGGTPGLLTERHLRRLTALLQRRISADAEWTIELTPGCVKRGKLEVLREAGVNRVSLGVQSFQPRLLEALGRQHPREKVLEAYDLLKAAGFQRVNLDLMFALPGQSLAEWEADLRDAVALAPGHLSTYCLTFEEDTALFVRLSRGEVKIDPETERLFFERAWDILASCGYRQYEISNFARPGHECIHNLNTWNMHDWIGLGPSAASQFGGWRGQNPADLRAWMEGLHQGVRASEERVRLTPEILFSDALVFGLRTNQGVSLEEVSTRFGVNPSAELLEWIGWLGDDGLLVRDEERLVLTPEGRLLADRIGSELLVRS